MKNFFFIFFAYFVVFFAQAQAPPSTEGKEFWVGFLPMIATNSTPQIIISSRLGATVRISVPKSPSFIPATLNVPANNTIIYAGLPTALVGAGTTTTYGTVQPNGILVESLTNDISVVASNQQNNYTEASIVVPKTALGSNTEYILNTPITNPRGVSPANSTFSIFRIVAIEDNTTIEINSPASLGSNTPNTPFTVTLQSGESIVYRATNTGTVMGDVVGTRIKPTGTCKPFAVFAGLSQGSAGCNNIGSSYQHMYEQQYPISTWGTKYLLTPLRGSATATGAEQSQGYMYRIVAAQDNTTIVIDNGTALTNVSLNANESVSIDANPSNSTLADGICVESNNPISVLQYMKGRGCNGSLHGNPAMVSLNPVNQMTDQAIFTSTPDNNNAVNSAHYVNVIMKTTDIGDLRVNESPNDPAGQAIAPQFVSFKNCNEYSYARILLGTTTGATATITSRLSTTNNKQFAAFAYGVHTDVAYMYSVGATFENLSYNFTITPPQICGTNKTINVVGTGANVLSYSWDFGDGSPVATGNNLSHTYTSTGTFIVKMIAQLAAGAGCGGSNTYEVTKTVNVFDIPTPNLGANRTVCVGTPLTLSVPNQPNQVVEWYRGNNLVGNNITLNVDTSVPNNSGSYKVKIIRGGFCEGESPAIQITIVETPQNVSISPANLDICATPNPTLTATAGFFYKWIRNGTDTLAGGGTWLGSPTNTFSPTLTGSYTCLISNSNGCKTLSNAVTVTGTAITATIKGANDQTVFCKGQSLVLEGTTTTTNPSFSYQWQRKINGVFVDVLGATNKQYNTSIADTFRLKVDLAGACVSFSNELIITERNKPAAVATANTTTICQGNNVDFTTIAAPTGIDYEYTWYKDGFVVGTTQNYTFAANDIGTFDFYVKIKDKSLLSLCDSTSNTVTVTVSALPNPVITVLGVPIFCSGESRILRTLKAPTGQTWTYQWYKNNTVIAGATADTLIVADNATTGSGNYIVEIRQSATCFRKTTTPFAVTIYPLPKPTLTIKDSYCNKEPLIVPQVSPTGGIFKLNGVVMQPPYSTTLLGTGTYTLRYIAFSERGCKDSVEKTFIINNSPVADITTTIDEFLCSNTANFNLNATPLGGQFVINGGTPITNTAPNSVTFNPNSITAGGKVQIIYNFTAANGCTASDTVNTFIVIPPKAPTLNNITTCESVGNVLLSAYEASHTTFTQYEWTNTSNSTVLATTPSLRVSQTGTYQVKITDDRACASTIKQVTVTFNPSPKVNLGANQSVCGNVPTVLDADPTNSNPATVKYLWSTGATTKSIRLQADTLRGLRSYWVKVTDESSPTKCEAKDTILLFFNNLPAVDLGKDRTICSPNDVPYTIVGFDVSHTADVTYKWFTPNAPATTLATTPNYAITQAGTYTLQVSTGAGCSRSDTVKIDFNNNPTVKLLGFDNGVGVCQLKDTLYLQVDNPQNFDILWSGAGIASISDNKLSAIVDKSGRYFVKVIDKTQTNKCDAVVWADVFIADFPAVKISPTNAEKKIVACQDSTVLLNAQQATHLATFRYEWRKVGENVVLATTPTLPLTYNIAKNYLLNRYVVRVIPPSGCVSNDTIAVQFVEKATAQFKTAAPQQICLGETFTVEATGGTTYQWTSTEPNAAALPATAKVTIRPTTAGTFTYTVTVGTANTLCAATRLRFVVQVNPSLVAKIKGEGISKDTKFCETNSLLGNGFDAMHPTTVRYSWKNLANNQILGTAAQQALNSSTLGLTPSASGNYPTVAVELEVKDIFTGCSNRDTIKVSIERKAQPKIQAPTTVCVGDTMLLKVTGGSQYQWQFDSLQDKSRLVIGATNTNTFRVIHQESGWKTYWVAASWGNSCEVVRDSLRIFVHALPVAVAHTQKNMQVCSGDVVTFNASGGIRYEWSHGATTANTNVTIVSDSCFVVKVFNENGCMDTDTVCVKIIPIKKLPPRLLLCERERTVLDATNPSNLPATYSWNNGYQSPTIPIFKAGIYTVTVKVANCEYQQTCEVIYKNTPQINLNRDTLLCFSVNNEIENPPYRTYTHRLAAELTNREAGETYLYTWQMKGSSTPLRTGTVGSDNLAPLDVSRLDTTYIVSLQTQTGNCVTEDTITVKVNCTARVKMPTAFSPNGDKLNDTFAPLTSDLVGISIQIYHKWGDIIFDKFIDPENNEGWDGVFKEEDGWDGTYNGSHVPVDNYQYVIVYWSKDRKGNIVRKDLTGSVAVMRK